MSSRNLSWVRPVFMQLYHIGQIINSDAYVRLTDYAVQVIRERKTKKLPLSVTEEELAEQLVLTFIG